MTTSHKSQENFIIGESKKRFQSNKWNVFTAAATLPKVGKVFAVPVSFLFSAKEESALSEAIPQAFYMLFEQLEEHDTTELFQVILQDVWVENGTRLVDIGKDFDDIADLLELVAKVLKQQYGAMLKGKSILELFQTIVPVSQASA